MDSIAKYTALLSFDWDDREQYDKNKKIKKMDVYATISSEAYLTFPFLLPFSPKSHSILEANAIHGFTDEQLVSHILPNECCWFTRNGHVINRIPDSFLTCRALLDYSAQREWIRQKVAVPHPTEFSILLDNRNMGERIFNNPVRQNHAVGTNEINDHDILRECKIVNLKVEKDSLVGSNRYEFNEKKN
ncbi:hypothetical protein P5V15_006536 [Pogonomyrmex californicus]